MHTKNHTQFLRGINSLFLHELQHTASVFAEVFEKSPRTRLVKVCFFGFWGGVCMWGMNVGCFAGYVCGLCMWVIWYVPPLGFVSCVQ